MHNYRQLNVWNRSVAFAIQVYECTNDFPKEEVYGLRAQIRKSVVSIASNIAEGAYRKSDREFVHFLSISNGSAAELETQLLIARKLDFVKQEQFAYCIAELDEIQKMVTALLNKLEDQKKPNG